jgi:hypothetical protein
VALLEIDAGMGTDAGDVDVEVAYTFAGGFEGESLGRLKDEDGGGFFGELLGDRAGDRAADLLLADEEEGDGARNLEISEDGDGGERHDDSGLHVKDARPGDLTGLLAPGHGFEGSVGPDGVEVAEEEDGFPASAADRFRGAVAEAELVDLAEVFLAVAFKPGSEFRGPSRGELLGSINCGRIFTWALDEHELLKLLEEPR